MLTLGVNSYETGGIFWRVGYLTKWNKSSRMLYSVRGLERSELGGSHGCPGHLWDRFLWQVYILRPKHRAYYRSGRPVIKIGPKGTLGSHEIRPIHSAPSLGQSITTIGYYPRLTDLIHLLQLKIVYNSPILLRISTGWTFLLVFW